MLYLKEEITLDNLAKHSCLNKIVVKRFVKDNLDKLSDYSPGEENLLISLATGLSYTQLILFNDFDRSLLRKIKRFLTLRLNHMPLNKIAKKAYFYLDEFYINNFVLAPRKETEILVESVLNYIEDSGLLKFNILDLCCGSGAIGLSVIKHAKKDCQVLLADVSAKALQVAQKNKLKFGLSGQVKTLKSDMFRGLKTQDKFDIIVSNPPYIKTSEIAKLDEGVKKFDPTIALNGGEDGLRFYKEIAQNAKDFLTEDGCIFMEIGYDQGKQVKDLFKKDYDVICKKDYSQNDRVVIAKLKR